MRGGADATRSGRRDSSEGRLAQEAAKLPRAAGTNAAVSRKPRRPPRPSPQGRLRPSRLGRGWPAGGTRGAAEQAPRLPTSNPGVRGPPRPPSLRGPGTLPRIRARRGEAEASR